MVGIVLHRDRRACMVRFFSAAGVEMEACSKAYVDDMLNVDRAVPSRRELVWFLIEDEVEAA